MAWRSYLTCSLAVFLISLFAAACWGDEAVQVFIGEKPVDLKGIAPAMLSGQVFVPVRPIAEAMGASLDWDRSAGALTIRGPHGSGLIRIGDPTARIRGTQVYFRGAPYLFGGHVYVPVIFFNEMFDMALIWDQFFNQLRWVPVVPPRPTGFSRPPVIIYGPGRRTPAPEAAPPVPETRIVVGELVRPLPSRTNPGIVVQTAGKTITYPVARDAIILRGRIGGPAMEVELGALRPGDRVTLRFSEEGLAITIRCEYNVASGRVQSIAKGTILLETGETLKVIPGTEVILPGNIRGEAEDIRIGDFIAARVSPITGRTYTVKVLPGAADKEPPAEEEQQIELNTTGLLRAGDTLIARFKAQAGGEAWLTIPGVAANVAMTEVEPGVYEGRYTVKQGDLLAKQPIKVTFAAPGGETYSHLSPRPITIRTAAGYLPRITSPRQGQEIASPVVVQGVAEPGSRVRVMIEYRRYMQRVLPVQGLTALEEVRADKNGVWETSPLPATSPFAEGDVDIPADYGVFAGAFRFEQEPPIAYIITAVSIGSNGQEQAAYRIEVTRKPGLVLEGLAPPLVELKRRSAG